VQLSQPPHDRARQVGDLMPAHAGDRDGQGTERGGLVGHRQDPAVTAQLVEQLPQAAASCGRSPPWSGDDTPGSCVRQGQ
jgi:hypothetical protein